MRGEPRTILGRQPIVLAENVPLDLNDASARETGNLLTRRIRGAIDVIVGGMIMRMNVIMIVMAMMMVTMFVIVMMVTMMMVVPVMMSGMIMAVIVSVGMVVLTVIVRMISGLDGRLAVTTATHRAHYSTSSSLTRMSSPPVTCS